MSVHVFILSFPRHETCHMLKSWTCPIGLYHEFLDSEHLFLLCEPKASYCGLPWELHHLYHDYHG